MDGRQYFVLKTVSLTFFHHSYDAFSGVRTKRGVARIVVLDDERILPDKVENDEPRRRFTILIERFVSLGDCLKHLFYVVTRGDVCIVHRR